jgi:phenylalanyl-tRNA synthetase beta chain
VRRGKKGESVILIDGKRREIDEDVLVIADSAKLVAIAGIMGCENSEVKENTKNILIESAVFAPYVIRKSSKKLGLTSDASLRFERGIDADTATNGMARTLFLIKETSQGKIGKLSSVGKKTEKIREVSIDIKKINKVLGVNVEEDFILSVLRKLDFLLDKKNKHFYIVKPPSYRNDIKEDVDIIEEVARYGDYSEIPSNMPISTIKPTLLENESKI